MYGLGIAFIFVFLAAFFSLMLVFALIGRRVGDERRCRKCLYMLQGLSSERCPECGTALSPENTVIGMRQRSWPRVLIALALLLLTLTPVFALIAKQAFRYDWYRLKPTGWVISDLGSTATDAKAASELKRRIPLKKLSGDHWHELVEISLNEQKAGAASRGHVLELIVPAIESDRLTAEQKARFVAQARRHRLVARHTVAEGARLPYRIEYGGTMPGGMALWVKEEQGSFAHDSDPPREFREGGRTSGGGGGASSSSTEAVGAVGRHELKMRTRWTVYVGQMSQEEQSTVLGSHETVLSAPYQVVPPAELPPIEELNDADLRAQLAAAITPVIRQRTSGGRELRLEIKKAPCDFAVEVVIVSAAGERVHTTFSIPKGTTTSWHLGGEITEPDPVQIRLRGKPEAAYNSVDLWSTFVGEIIYDDVKVEQLSY